MARKIGVFGGSFDPVHLGHLWISEAARETLSLDEVRWLPAATSPLKPDGPVASDEARLRMVRLAVSGNPYFVVDDREIRRGKISYTVDTIAEIMEEHPDDELFLIIGGDSLASFGLWHQPKKLLGMVTLAIVARGGIPAPDLAVIKSYETRSVDRHQIVSMPLIEVSSREIRARIAAGKTIRYQVPAPVDAMIRAESLYAVI